MQLALGRQYSVQGLRYFYRALLPDYITKSGWELALTMALAPLLALLALGPLGPLETLPRCPIRGRGGGAGAVTVVL